MDGIAEAGRLGACELGAGYRACEAHAAAGCQRRLRMHGRKLACITRASCANAHGARCSRPRRVRVCRGGCRPPAARWKRRSKLRIVVPIMQHNSVWSDHRIMLSKCWSVTMCWNHCRCYLSAISSSCWWTGTPRWTDWSMWMLCGDFLRRTGVVQLLFVWAFFCWPTVDHRYAEAWSKLVSRGQVMVNRHGQLGRTSAGAGCVSRAERRSRCGLFVSVPFVRIRKDGHV